MCSRFADTLVNTIGHRAAERALQLGLLFPPAEALQVGIVDQVVPEDQVQSTARSVMAQWLAVPGEKPGAGGPRQLWVLQGQQSHRPPQPDAPHETRGYSRQRAVCKSQPCHFQQQAALVLGPP